MATVSRAISNAARLTNLEIAKQKPAIIKTFNLLLVFVFLRKVFIQAMLYHQLLIARGALY